MFPKLFQGGWKPLEVHFGPHWLSPSTDSVLSKIGFLTVKNGWRSQLRRWLSYFSE